MADQPRPNWHSAMLLGMLLLLLGSGLEAQRGPGSSGEFAVAIGPRVGGDVDEKAWSFGGQARIALPQLPGFQVAPSADVFFLDGQNEWQINLDVVLQLFPIVYGGAGLAIAQDSLPTSTGPSIETGYNLFLGVTTPPLPFPVRPFVEGRWTDINRVVRPWRVVFGLDLLLRGEPYRRR